MALFLISSVKQIDLSILANVDCIAFDLLDDNGQPF